MGLERIGLLGLAALAAIGCASEPTTHKDPAPAVMPGTPHARDASTPDRSATSAPGRTSEANGLNVDIELAPSDDATPCSACFDVRAVARGGHAPYHYTWSDPALQGEGPHRICPTHATELSVTVSDTGTDDEFGGASSSAQASRRIEPPACSTQLDASIIDLDARADADAEPIDAAPPAADAAVDAGGPICACSNAPPTSDEHFLDDSSFEGTTGAGQTPSGWTVCQGSPDLLPALDVGGLHPSAASDGTSYLGLSIGTSITQPLREPMRAGQHYWLSWAEIETGILASGFGELDIWLGNAACQSTRLAGANVWNNNSIGVAFSHACSEVVPDRDYEYITIASTGGGTPASGYVNFDNLRIAAYDFPTRVHFETGESGIPNCAYLPLETPFP